MRIRHLRVNHLKNPLGYDFPYLTFSWKVVEAVSGCSDKVRLLISEKEDMSQIVYDSGEIDNYRQCQLEVPLDLNPRTKYYWKVFVKTDKGEQAESEAAWFETAKMEEAWEAHFISAAEDKKRMPVLYRDFTVSGGLKKARLYIFAAGLYEVEINGDKAGNEYLLPGYHSYDLLLEYQTFDIMEYLRNGENRISILLGEGWYKGRFGFDDVYYNLYGDRKKCIAEIVLEYESGHTEKICTNSDWKACTGCIGENGIFHCSHPPHSG